MTILDFMSKTGVKQYKKYDGEIGIEIETETKSQSSYPSGLLVSDERNGKFTVPSLRYWDTHVDGSLRDFGLEYVLKQPMKFDKEIPAALEEFRDKLGKVRFIKDSITTSDHVHLNMLNESFKTMGNFLTLYTLFENLLIRYSGPDRLSNLFCLPICDAEDTYRNIVTMMQYVEKKQYKGLLFSEQLVKYAALNLASFSQYGSLEVRSFRGETDTKAILNWVAILYSILEYSRQVDLDPKRIMLNWKDRQQKFLDDVFRDYRKELAHKDELDLIDKNVWYAGSIAYSVKNWNSVDEINKSQDFKPKQKDLEAHAARNFNLPWINLDNAQQDYIVRILREEYQRKAFAKPEQAPAEGDWNGLRPAEMIVAAGDGRRPGFNRMVNINEPVRRDGPPPVNAIPQDVWVEHMGEQPAINADAVNEAFAQAAARVVNGRR